MAEFRIRISLEVVDAFGGLVHHQSRTGESFQMDDNKDDLADLIKRLEKAVVSYPVKGSDLNG